MIPEISFVFNDVSWFFVCNLCMNCVYFFSLRRYFFVPTSCVFSLPCYDTLYET